jgi:hypothetical protein
MSDVMPKVKLWLFLSIVSLLINIGAFCVSAISNTGVSFGSFIGSALTSFIPFVDLINLAFLNLPTEIMIIVGIATGIISILKAYLLIVIIFNFFPTIDV